MLMGFIINYNQICKQKPDKVICTITKCEKKRLDKLRLYDFIVNSSTGRPLKIVHGVYLFFSTQKKCLYVGKSSSRQFIERIPCHLALGDHAWFNQLLKFSKNEFKSYVKAIEATKKFTLLMISVKDKKKVKNIEKLLKLIIEPKYNSYKPVYTQRMSSRINSNESFDNILKDLQ